MDSVEAQPPPMSGRYSTLGSSDVGWGLVE